MRRFRVIVCLITPEVVVSPVLDRLGREVCAEPDVEPRVGYQPWIGGMIVFLVVGGFVVGEAKSGTTESVGERELFELDATKESALCRVHGPKAEAKRVNFGWPERNEILVGDRGQGGRHEVPARHLCQLFVVQRL